MDQQNNPGKRGDDTTVVVTPEAMMHLEDGREEGAFVEATNVLTYNVTIDDHPAPSSGSGGDGHYSNSPTATATATATPTIKTAFTTEPPSSRTDKGRTMRRWLALALTVVIVGIVILVSRDKDDNTYMEPMDPPVAHDFTTGVALVTYYAVNATISSRLARTVLTMDVTNALDCASIRGVTFQLPVAARVASLKTLSNDGCETNGVVLPLEQARETFAETSASGLPGAYVEERDSFTYSLQVTMPPLGTTRVELVLEELLKQRVGEVEFQIPLAPNEKIDRILLDIAVLDVTSESAGNATAATNGTKFYMTNLRLGSVNPEEVHATSTYHLDIPDAQEHDLPKVLRGFFSPANLPPSGVLYSDGVCFEHYFNPPSLTPMPRSIVFLMDVSEGMEQGTKFQDAKKALKALIDSMTEQDTLSIQTFAEGRGTVDFWGAATATVAAKAEAKLFVDKLVTRCCGTNLHEAFLEGLLRAKNGADNNGAPIVMTLSDGWPSVGEWDRAKIATDVWKLNQEGKVKIFSLGFENADLELLNAIAIMNGGVSGSIVESHSINYSTQMEDFFQSEFGSVLLSDVRVQFVSGDDAVVEVTQTTFPVLAKGTELVVRGMLENSPDSGNKNALQAITTAMTSAGKEMTWTATAVHDRSAFLDGLKNSLCFQSYAHSRITRLLALRDAARLLGDEVLEPVVTLVKTCVKNSTWTFADCIEEEALTLALKANVVTAGLTGLVTIDDQQCLSFEKETEICMDGITGSDPLGVTMASSTSYSGVFGVGSKLWLFLFPVVVLICGLGWQ